MQKTRYRRDPKDADVFASDYAFAQGKVGPKNNVVIGYGNKNPNIAKRRIGKKNKPISTLWWRGVQFSGFVVFCWTCNVQVVGVKA